MDKGKLMALAIGAVIGLLAIAFRDWACSNHNMTYSVFAHSCVLKEDQ